MGLFSKNNKTEKNQAKRIKYEVMRLTPEEMAQKMKEIFLDNAVVNEDYIDELNIAVKGPNIFAEYATKEMISADQRYRFVAGLWKLTPFLWPSVLNFLYHIINPQMDIVIEDQEKEIQYLLDSPKSYKKFYSKIKAFIDQTQQPNA